MRRITPNAIVFFSGVAVVAASCAVPPDDTPVNEEDQTGGSGGTTPGIGGNAGTPPTAGTSQGGTAPGVGGTAPGVGGTTPGVGGTTPGVGGTTPGIGGTPSAGIGGTTPGAGMGGTATGGVGGSVAGASGAGTGTGGTSTTCMPNPPAQNCSGTAAPTDAVVIDFASFQTSGTWGVSGMGDLTGGTSYYQGSGVTQLTAVVESGSLHVTGMLPAYTAATGDPENYAGIVFWFGPCVNASAFTGLSLNVGGALTGGALKLQVQTHLDYPVDIANTKGGCIFTSCESRWSECVGPTTTVTVPSAPAALAWSAFTGGKPMTTVTPEGLVGLQFQFECQAETPCTVDVTLGTITLTM